MSARAAAAPAQAACTSSVEVTVRAGASTSACLLARGVRYEVSLSPEIDVDLYQGVMQQLESVDGLRCAVLADETGTRILGHGDLTDNLAAFGAYIRDASGRTERLLPLEAVEAIDIRDNQGMLLSMRVVLPQNGLSIVLLGMGEGSIATAKKTIATGLNLPL